MKTRCRHRDTWIIAGGSHEWCYRCGAFRSLAPASQPDWLMSGHAITWRPTSPWCRPVGPKAGNPYTTWAKRRDSYRAKRKIANSGVTVTMMTVGGKEV